MFKVAIIGAGIGAAHMDGYLQMPDQYHVAIVCDLAEDRAQALAARADGCRTESDLDLAIADGEIDIVDICLPPHLHCEVALKALAGGKNVVCEKPLARSLGEADRIIAASERSGKAVLPVFQYRYGRGYQQLLDLIEGGFCGKPLVATLETHWNRGADYYAVPWRGTWAGESGGAILGHAIHAHDLVCKALGPVQSVSALLDTRVNPIEVDDCAAIALKMASGALATSSITLGSAEDMSRLRFCFEHLTAESGREPYHPGGCGWTFEARDPARQPELESLLAAGGGRSEGFAGLFGEFARSLRGEPNRTVTLQDGRRSLELVTAIYQSARQGKAVELPVSRSDPDYGGWTSGASGPG